MQLYNWEKFESRGRFFGNSAMIILLRTISLLFWMLTHLVIFQQIRIFLQNFVDDLHLSRRFRFIISALFGGSFRSCCCRQRWRRSRLSKRSSIFLSLFLFLNSSTELVDGCVQTVGNVFLFRTFRRRRSRTRRTATFFWNDVCRCCICCGCCWCCCWDNFFRSNWCWS